MGKAPTRRVGNLPTTAIASNDPEPSHPSRSRPFRGEGPGEGAPRDDPRRSPTQRASGKTRDKPVPNATIQENQAGSIS